MAITSLNFHHFHLKMEMHKIDTWAASPGGCFVSVTWHLGRRLLSLSSSI
jgi:hypothetical protein